MRILLVSLIFSLAMTVLAQTDDELLTLEERGYGIYLPADYDDTVAVPLVIVLHGFGDEWHNFSGASGFMSLADEYGFIVAFPNGYLRQWNDGGRGDHYEDDVRMLEVLIERVARDYPIQRERVYLVGFSNGGTMVYKAACEAPDVFAGIAAIAGTMRRNQICPDEAQVPMMLIHGTADRTVPFTGGDGRYSAPATALFWAIQNECVLEDVPDYDSSNFQSSIGIYYYEDCADGKQVLLYAIEDMPHAYPGAREYSRNVIPDSRIDTARLIWGFFDLNYEALQEAIETTPEA